MKYQAAFMTNLPVQILAGVFGPMDIYGDIFITKRAYDSEEHLKTLIGTAEDQAEHIGGSEIGACIIPLGAVPPKDKKNYRSRMLLRNRLDYGVEAPPNQPVIFELRPPNQKFYAAKVEDLEHPESIVVPPNEWYEDGLKEKNVVGYFNAVSDLIVKQYVNYDLDGMTLIKVDDQVIIKRHAEIEVQGMKIGDQEAFDSLNRGRTVEFHFAIGEDTKLVWIDLDPKPEFPWDDVKSIAAELAGRLGQMPESLQTEIRFSGKSGFHVICIMQNMMPTDVAKDEMKKFVEEFIAEKNDDRLTMLPTKDSNMMRLDYSTLHTTGGLRAAYSLAYPTGLVCLPLTPHQVANFDKSQATVEKVLERIGRLDRMAKITMDETHALLRTFLEHIWHQKTVNTSVAREIVTEILPKFKDDADAIAREIAAIYKFEEQWVHADKVRNELDLLKQIVDIPVSTRNLIAKWWQGPVEYNEAQIIKDLRDAVNDDDKFAKIIASITRAGSIETGPLEKRLLGLEQILKLKPEASALLMITAEDLEKYWEKREFDATPEPKGEVHENRQEIFVIQKHDAEDAGLHYDLRLSIGGVLQSWVFRKLPDLISGTSDMVRGPRVEDHPLEYAKFQGTIPSGYGAGKVVLWDKGTYEMTSESDDTMRVVLHGNKMQGPFTLFKLGGQIWELRRGSEQKEKIA